MQKCTSEMCLVKNPSESLVLHTSVKATCWTKMLTDFTNVHHRRSFEGSRCRTTTKIFLRDLPRNLDLVDAWFHELSGTTWWNL